MMCQSRNEITGHCVAYGEFLDIVVWHLLPDSIYSAY